MKKTHTHYNIRFRERGACKFYENKTALGDRYRSSRVCIGLSYDRVATALALAVWAEGYNGGARVRELEMKHTAAINGGFGQRRLALTGRTTIADRAGSSLHAYRLASWRLETAQRSDTIMWLAQH